MLQLAALSRHPDAALEIIERYEQACLQEASSTPAPARAGAPARIAADGNSDGNDAAGNGAIGPHLDPDLTARLLAEENRLAVGAKLAWVEYARRELSALRARDATARADRR